MGIRATIRRESGDVEIPVQDSTLRIARPVNQHSRASFTLQVDALTARTIHPVQRALPPPGNRSPDGGLLFGIVTAGGGAFQFIPGYLLTNSFGVTSTFPQTAEQHGITVGDLLYFPILDPLAQNGANALFNEPLVVTAVRDVSTSSGTGGRVTVDYRSESPLPRNYSLRGRISHWGQASWRHATGSDVVSIARVAVPPAPAGLTAAPGDGEASLSWDSAPVTIDSVQYRHRIGTQDWLVLRGVSDAQGWINFPAGTTDAGIVPNLTNNIDYTMEVRFVNALGPGDEAAVSVTPRATLGWAGVQSNLYLFAGTGYTVQMPELRGGVPPLSVATTGIPAGMALRFNGTDNRYELHGAPTTPQGLTAVTLTATDSTRPTPAASLLSFEIAVFAAGSDVSPVFADDAITRVWREGQAIVADDTSGTGGELPAAASGNAPITYSLSPALNIGGVSFDAATRRFSGTPNAELLLQTYALTARDADGDTDTLTVNLRVLGASQTTAMWPSVNDVVVDAGRAFSIQIPAAMGSVSDYRFTGLDTNGMLESGVSPPTIAGLTYTNSTRTLSGTIANPVARTRIGIEARDSHTGEWVGTIFNFECRQVASAPAAPVSVTLTGGQRRLTVDFSAPAADDSVTGLEYEWRQARGPWITPAISVAPVPASNRLTITSFPSVPRLGNNVEYGLRLRFVNAVGSGAWTEAADVRTGTVPGGVTITQSGGLTTDSSIVVAWSAATGTVDSYEISHKLSSAAVYSAWTAVSGGAAARSATVTGLTSGTRYDVRVRARNAAGPGTWQRLGCQTAFAPATGVTHTRRRSQYWIGFTVPASGAVNAADRATITGVRGWIERSIGYQPPGIPFSAVSGAVQGFAPGSNPSGIRNLNYSALAGQWYRARVRVESGTTQSADAYSAPAQIPSGAQGGAGGQSAPSPPPPAPPGPQGQQQAVPAPPWVRAKWTTRDDAVLYWGGVTGATRYFIEVFDDTGTVLASADTGPDARSATLSFNRTIAAGSRLRARVASDPGRQFTSSEDGDTAPWTTDAFDLSSPVEVETARPHGLTDNDIVDGNRVVFNRIAGTLDATAAVTATQYPITRIISDTVFHAAVGDTEARVYEGGQRNPVWLKVLRQAETAPWDEAVPQEGEEIRIFDPEAGPAVPHFSIQRTPDALQVLQNAGETWIYYGALRRIDPGQPVVVDGTGEAGYSAVERRAVVPVPVPAWLSNLSQIAASTVVEPDGRRRTRTNAVGWADPPPDTILYGDVFNADPLLPATDLQEVHGIAQEPPGAVNAGTRFQIAVQERALTRFPQLGPGRYIALENVHGTPSLLQRNIWRILSMPDPLRLDDPDDDDSIPVSASSPVRARIRGVALTVGESSSHSAPYAGVATPTGIQAFDWQTFGIAKWIPATQGEATQFSFNAHGSNGPPHLSLPKAETDDLRILGMHYSPQGQHTLTVYRDLDVPRAWAVTREVRNGGARIRFGWVWTGDELTRLQAAQAAGGTWSFMLVSRAFAAADANDFDLDNLTWKGRTIDIANISREFQMQGLTATAHSRWRPLIRNTAQLRQRRGVLSIAPAANNRARVTVEAGQQIPVSVSDIIAFEDADIDLGASFGANRYIPDTDEYIVEDITLAQDAFLIRAATGRTWRVDPDRDPFTHDFQPSEASAVRMQVRNRTTTATGATWDGRTVTRIVQFDAGAPIPFIEANGDERAVADITLSEADGARLGLRISRDAGSVQPIRLQADTLANYRIYIQAGTNVLWADLSAGVWSPSVSGGTNDYYLLQIPDARRPAGNWFTASAARGFTFNIYIVDTRSQFGFDQATRTVGHDTTWMQVSYPQGPALPSEDRANRVSAVAWDGAAQQLTLTTDATTGLSASTPQAQVFVQVFGLAGLPAWWLSEVRAVTDTTVTLSVMLRAAPTLDPASSDLGYPYWRRAVLDQTKISVNVLSQERLFGGVVYGAHARSSGREPNAGRIDWQINCVGFMKALEDTLVKGSFSVSSQDLLGAAIARLFREHLTGAGLLGEIRVLLGGSPVVSDTQYPGNVRLVAPADAPAGRLDPEGNPLPVVIDTTSWKTGKQALDRLLENVRGAWCIDQFKRLCVTLPDDRPVVHPLVLDQRTNVWSVEIHRDPRHARSQTAVVGEPLDTGIDTLVVTGDGAASSFPLNLQITPENFAVVRLQSRGVSTEPWRNIAVGSLTAEWRINYDTSEIESTRTPPDALAEGAQLRITYAYSTPALAESERGDETGRERREDDPEVSNQLQARHRARVLNELYDGVVHRGKIRMVWDTGGGVTPAIPVEGSYVIARLAAFGYHDVHAFIAEVKVHDVDETVHAEYDVEFEASPIPHFQSRYKDWWDRKLGREGRAQRQVRAFVRSAVESEVERQIPDDVVVRQGLNLPEPLGGAERFGNTSTAADGERIVGGAIVKVDGTRIPAGRVAWRASVRVTGDTASASLFLWDGDYEDPMTSAKGQQIGETSVSKAGLGTDAATLVEVRGLTLRADPALKVELRCRRTDASASNADVVEVWGAVLIVEEEGE